MTYKFEHYPPINNYGWLNGYFGWFGVVNGYFGWLGVGWKFFIVGGGVWWYILMGWQGWVEVYSFIGVLVTHFSITQNRCP